MQYGFYYNIDECMGCKTCIVACKDTHNLPVGTKYRRVIEYGGGTWDDSADTPSLDGFFAYSIPVTCNHCANPACVESCPTGAMQKDPENGIVWSDSEVCIGCGTCVQTCPYDVPRILEDKKVCGKCDMCRELLPLGEQPACVASCLGRAIKFGDIEELRAEFGDLDSIHPLPSGDATNPSVVFKRHRMNPDDIEGGIISPEEDLY